VAHNAAKPMIVAGVDGSAQSKEALHWGPATSAGPPPSPQVPGPRPVPEYYGKGAGQQDLMHQRQGQP
jgi:hypothetical protein